MEQMVPIVYKVHMPAVQFIAQAIDTYSTGDQILQAQVIANADKFHNKSMKMKETNDLERKSIQLVWDIIQSYHQLCLPCLRNQAHLHVQELLQTLSVQVLWWYCNGDG